MGIGEKGGGGSRQEKKKEGNAKVPSNEQKNIKGENDKTSLCVVRGLLGRRSLGEGGAWWGGKGIHIAEKTHR